ncbi:endo-1,4-beta-xylanase [Arcticibacterium luteifluviistationis]|uniref:Beta-xylanase n=1 Tax=Arcticibacterium luteifluviistationis TaxID=1784714 RepID=A0A2Z4G920_9BACT|nr:endo-1,4-beta-xylanase [Arcticibacterium luteifluviistationis]AWV97634.1 1,4-beta-xylanase [Arcticibacterium luteifluviistationis]
MKFSLYKMTRLSLLFFLVIQIFSCQNVEKEELSLKNAFENDFIIGTAVGVSEINGSNLLADKLIKKQFKVITPENDMKSEIIHPEWDKYDFEVSDKIIAFGENNNIDIVGHTLIWHSQLSPFISEDISSDSLRLFMENHINTVGGRYDGKVLGWDVVNEALNEDGTLRNSIFLQKLGKNYIKYAFEYANKATPNSELYYNDYNIEQPEKREGVIKLVKSIQDAGLRIDGVGIQAHWSINNLPLKEIEESIIAFSKLNVKVMFTELDLTVLPNPWELQGADVNQNFEGDPKMNPYVDGLPIEVEQKLAESYKSLFELFLKHSDKISRVSFWGVNDGQSWLNGWPINNRTNYPLLFDRDYKPKKAFYEVIQLKAKQ